MKVSISSIPGCCSGGCATRRDGNEMAPVRSQRHKHHGWDEPIYLPPLVGSRRRHRHGRSKQTEPPPEATTLVLVAAPAICLGHRAARCSRLHSPSPRIARAAASTVDFVRVNSSSSRSRPAAEQHGKPSRERREIWHLLLPSFSGRRRPVELLLPRLPRDLGRMVVGREEREGADA